MSTPSGEPPYPGSQPNQPGYDPNQGYQQGYPQDQQGYPQARPGYGAEQGYGQQAPPGYGAGPVAPKNGLGIAALVLGILSLVATITVVLAILGIPLGLLALIFGIIGVRRVSKGLATNKGVAIAGLVTGLLGLIASTALVVISASIFFSSGGGDIFQCLQQAGGDQAKIAQCQQQIENQVSGGGS